MRGSSSCAHRFPAFGLPPGHYYDVEIADYHSGDCRMATNDMRPIYPGEILREEFFSPD